MSDSKIILLVEDEALVAIGEKRLLEKEGYQVRHVPDGESAIRIVCAENQPIDLILMDIHLNHEMDGVQTAQQILPRRDIPIIFLSSIADKDFIAKTEQVTSYGYVIKSHGAPVLLAAIQMAFRLHAMHRRLQESEHRYRALFENAVLGIFQSTLAGQVVAVNPTFARMFGYESPAEVYATVQDVATLFAEPQRREEIIHLRAENPELTSFENLYRRKDGSAFWGRLNVRSIDDADGQLYGLEGFVEDITERKRMEASLRASENTLRSWLDAFQESALLITPEGVVLMANATVAQRMHTTVPDLIGKSIFDYLPPESARTRRRYMEWVLESGQPVRFEDERFGRVIDNLVYPVFEQDGSIRQLAILATDITERKQMENTLRASEAVLRQNQARSRAMFQAIPDLIFRMDRQGVFLDYKADIRDIYAQSEPTLIGRRNRDISPPEFADLIDEKIHAALSTATLQTFEFQLPIPHRGQRDYEARMAASGPNEVTAIVRDITDRKKAEKALKESQANLLAIFNATEESIFLLSTDETILALNEVGAQRLERRQEELIGHKIAEFLSPELYAQRHPFVERVIATCQPVSHEDERYGHWLANYLYPILDEQGQVIRVALYSRDITQRKQVEAALNASDERFHVVANTAGDMIFTITPEGKVGYANELAAQAFNMSPQALIGRELRDLFPPEIYQHQWARLQKVFTTGKPLSEEYLTHFPGGDVWLETWLAPMYDSNGRVIAVLGDSRNISARKQAEEHIQRLLHEKELLLREVHHRIKNNMNTVASLLDLQANIQADLSAQTALQDASGQVRSMMVLYDKLYRTQEFGAVSLQDYIPSLLHEIVALFPHKDAVRIQTQIDPILLSPKIISPLGIILNELTTNAMKYAFPAPRQGVITVAAAQKDGRVSILFEDDGIGLPELFAVEDSAGFGMQLVGMLVQQIEGSLTVTKEAGTRFLLEFDPNL